MLQSMGSQRVRHGCVTEQQQGSILCIKHYYSSGIHIYKKPSTSVQFSSVTQSCSTLCNPMNRSPPGLPVHHQLLEFTQTPLSIELVMSSSHIILYRPLLLLPSVFPSIRVFSNESALYIRCAKYWSFSFSTNLSNEYSGLISFRIDWFDLLALQRTLKSLLQHHSWKVSILQCSGFFFFFFLFFFFLQLSHPY